MKNGASNNSHHRSPVRCRCTADALKKIKFVLAITITTCIVIVSVFLAIPGSPLKPGLVAWFNWLQQVPKIWSTVFFTVLQLIAVMLVLPATPFNLAAGYMYTIWLGSLISLTALNVSAILSFLIGRYLAREWAEAQIEKKPMFQAIDNAVGDRGFYIVFLVTLAPVFPSGICHYLFGITKVSFCSYTVATIVGLVPGTVAFTYVGSLMGDIADIFNDQPLTGDNVQAQIFWLSIAVVTAVAMIILLCVITRRALVRVLQENETANVRQVHDLQLQNEMGAV
eukprot:TRINITY_DN27378_c1_g1_i1.p1 TRINITY_DN27378_c1_g1~~TRINITY_DN27378_c1_g1_i1.p1  ORF type:complete len:282 (-),score=-2.61 TRINITY_DN27378_c1_g1_i1:373-1218(-)